MDKRQWRGSHRRDRYIGQEARNDRQSGSANLQIVLPLALVEPFRLPLIQHFLRLNDRKLENNGTEFDVSHRAVANLGADKFSPLDHAVVISDDNRGFDSIDFASHHPPANADHNIGFLALEEMEQRSFVSNSGSQRDIRGAVLRIVCELANRQRNARHRQPGEIGFRAISMSSLANHLTLTLDL